MTGWGRGGGRLVQLIALVAVSGSIGVLAHPTPFSYVDIRVDARGVHLSLSAHVVDVAHDLGVERPEALLTGALPEPAAGDFARSLVSRLDLRANGSTMSCRPQPAVESLPETQTLRWSFSCAETEPMRTLGSSGPLFPYDPEHQTFVNLYLENALVGQATLDAGHRNASFELAASGPSRLVTFHRFLIAGIHHLLGGPDHLLFLAGLLLAGGNISRLATIVTAFTIAHSVTLSLAVLDILTPPSEVIEPLIALSIVYVGLRNLWPSKSGDWRAIGAGTFGLIHGFGFAYALREMRLPRADLAWSLFSFNAGVEIGQLAVVIVTAMLLAGVRRSGWISDRHLLVCGTLVVATAGLIWFVERVAVFWR